MMLKHRTWLAALSLVVIGAFVGACGGDDSAPEQISHVVTTDGGVPVQQVILAPINVGQGQEVKLVKLMPIVLPDGGYDMQLVKLQPIILPDLGSPPQSTP